MGDMKHLLVAIACAFGFGLSLFSAYLWAVGAFNDWRVLVHWNRWGEAWVDGVLITAAIILTFTGLILSSVTFAVNVANRRR